MSRVMCTVEKLRGEIGGLGAYPDREHPSPVLINVVTVAWNFTMAQRH